VSEFPESDLLVQEEIVASERQKNTSMTKLDFIVLRTLKNHQEHRKIRGIPDGSKIQIIPFSFYTIPISKKENGIIP